MIIVILSMPFIRGQASGLVTGVVMVVLYSLIYLVLRFRASSARSVSTDGNSVIKKYQLRLSTEFSEELMEKIDKQEKEKYEK